MAIDDEFQGLRVDQIYEALGHRPDVEQHLGAIAQLTPAQWPQALALAWLAGAAWSEEEYLASTKRLGVPLTTKDITAALPAETPAPVPTKTRKATR